MLGIVVVLLGLQPGVFDVVDFHIEAPLPARPLHGFGELVDRKGFGELIENAAFALRRRISDSQIDALDGIADI